MEVEWYNPDAGAPLVSVANYGITFTSGAVEVLDKPEYIKIGLDISNKAIIVQPCSENDKGAMKFKDRIRRNNVRMSSKDFIRFIKSRIDDEVIGNSAQKYIANWDEESKTLTIDLDEPITT